MPGWSGLCSNGDGSFLAMPDNGFGSRGNSADYVLGFYRIQPEPKTHGDGTTRPGPVVNTEFTALSDPDRILANGAGVDLTLTADLRHYVRGDGVDSGLPVDPAIARGRVLTGYDFDVESVARAADGTLWIGDEFGPFLLHFSDDGRLLDEPVPHPFLKSPSHPDVLAGRATPTLGASRGFEALAFDPQTSLLYVVPEAAALLDGARAHPGDERVVEIFEFDPAQKAYTGRTFPYRKGGDATDNAILIGDMASVGKQTFVLIERDAAYAAQAVVKRLYLVDLAVRDAEGVLHKRLLLDLLQIDDPLDIGGDLPGLAAAKFSMPFDSIECVHALDASTLVIAIDTNFPNEDARHPGSPDDSELIELRFALPLVAYAPRPRRASEPR